MLIIKCAKCKTKLFKYQKIGKGRVLRCWKARIHKSYIEQQSNDEVRCKCGNIFGVDEGGFIKMRQNAFIYSGTKD